MPPEIDPVIHQPVRTRILALLLNEKACDYSRIKARLALSDGHMSTHMKVLLEEGYVSMEKAFVVLKPRTTYRLTKLGKKRFEDYVTSLQQIIQGM